MARGVALFAMCVAAVACRHGASTPTTTLALHAACADAEYWDGAQCKRRGDGAKKIDAGAAALATFDVDTAKQALDAAEHAGPLAHSDNVRLWEQRGIAAAYV